MTAFVRCVSLSEVAANVPRRPPHARQLADAARGTAGVLVLPLAVWFLIRRWYGAFSSPLDAGHLIPLAFVLVTVAWCLTLSARVVASWQLLLKTLPLLSVVAVGISVSLPGSDPVTLAAFWAVIVLGTLPLLTRCYFCRDEKPTVVDKGRIARANAGNDAQSLDQLRAGELPIDESREANAGQDVAFGQVDERSSLNDEVTHQITRARLADGSHVVHGVLRASFAAGERLASVHVGFCPPFQCRPRIETSWSEGPESTVKPAQILPYGARFDVWLASKPTAETSVLIEFHAVA